MKLLHKFQGFIIQCVSDIVYFNNEKNENIFNPIFALDYYRRLFSLDKWIKGSWNL